MKVELTHYLLGKEEVLGYLYGSKEEGRLLILTGEKIDLTENIEFIEKGTINKVGEDASLVDFVMSCLKDLR